MKTKSEKVREREKLRALEAEFILFYFILRNEAELITLCLIIYMRLGSLRS